ncbi:HNH endonuclease [Elizabethkingia sp. YR214]|uniref:HNH endonuclease n=1 Tax=Elizabethkingia sp. YR214 TaxID=2135667 RepID=UPI000D300CE1|nr:HNH endonuclease [Elizabethkingia sp. YR214]PUB34400.1 HNH endonuclease [Elizabethkingia sp. YR214]
MTENLWVLKTVHENHITSLIDSYQDSLTEYYNYDSNVANSKQIKAGDQAIIIDKKQVLGFATIAQVKESTGEKIIRKCPICANTTIDIRKQKLPEYRCSKGHEFEIPIEETKTVTKYSAIFSSFSHISSQNRDLAQLRPYYSSNYNPNMSMQRLDLDALSLFSVFSNDYSLISITPEEGYIQKETEQYTISNQDEREIIQRAIKLRRGQQSFRKELLKKYNNTCVITGCKITDILEAAHINPYRGNQDNHLSNGLLLRADIHTLFDLNLLGINPENFRVVIADKLKGSEYEQYHNKEINIDKEDISLEALIRRYAQ